MAIPSELAERPVIQKLAAFNPRALTGAVEFRQELTLIVLPSLIRDVCEFLRGDPALRFDLLSDLTAVDRYPVEPRFEVVYHLRSMSSKQRVRLKAPLPGADPQIDSVVSLWPVADMLECEVFDLFGIRFIGHPNLRRLLMPDDWEGHPLRKDYPVEGYR